MTGPAQVPQAAREYFGAQACWDEHPTVEQVFRPGRGWRIYPGRKAVNGSWARKARQGTDLSAMPANRLPGVTHVALRCGRRVADFRIEELVR